MNPTRAIRAALRSLTLGLSLALAPGAAAGDTAEEDGADPAVRWAVFREDDLFRIHLPAEPEHKTNVHVTMLGPVVETDYSARHQDSYYIVEHVQIPRLASFVVTTNKLLERAQEDRLGDVGAEALSSRAIVHTGYDGLAVRYRIPGEPPVEGELRLFVVGRRLFMLDAGGRDGAWRPELAERFFGSFEPTVP